MVGERGAYRLAQTLPTIQVPATVQAVLAARIDRLPAEEKRLLQTAAVIGTEVPLPLLQAIADLPEAALHRGMAHLQATEFLYETRLFPDHAYTFKHALTHEVAYGSLLQERRRVLHARIVAAIEQLQADRLADHVEQLAHHALRGGLWDQALLYCRQAGVKAMARSAYREAVGYFEQALIALQHVPESRDVREQAVDLRLDLRQALFAFGAYERILATLHEAETVAEALGDRRRLGQVATYMSQYFWATGNQEQALAAGQRALAFAEPLGDVALQAIANIYLGQAYQNLGDSRPALECLRRSVASLEGALRWERLGLPYLPSVFARMCLVASLAEMGAFAEGTATAAEAVQIAEAANHPLSRIAAYIGVGWLSFLKGDLQQAIPVLERSLALSQEANIPTWPANTSNLGAAYVLTGRIAEALPLLERAVEDAAAMRLTANQALWVTRLGEAALLDGHLEDASTLARHALALARARKGRVHEAYALRLLGDIAAHGEPLEVEPAAIHYRQALTLAEELGMRPLQAHCHRGLGILYAKVDPTGQARTELSAAIELYRAMEMAFWMPQTEAALAEVRA